VNKRWSSRAKNRGQTGFPGTVACRHWDTSRKTPATTRADVSLLLADGSVAFESVLELAESDRFESADDLTLTVMNALPRHAVGEPSQSEGEG